MDEPITRREEYYAGIAEAMRNGGSGGGSVEPVIVHLEMIDNHLTADKTNAEISALMDAGTPVYVHFLYGNDDEVEVQITGMVSFSGRKGFEGIIIDVQNNLMGCVYSDAGDTNDAWNIAIYSISRSL